MKQNCSKRKRSELCNESEIVRMIICFKLIVFSSTAATGGCPGRARTGPESTDHSGAPGTATGPRASPR